MENQQPMSEEEIKKAKAKAEEIAEFQKRAEESRIAQDERYDMLKGKILDILTENNVTMPEWSVIVGLASKRINSTLDGFSIADILAKAEPEEEVKKESL